MSLTWPEITAWRLERHYLTAPAAAKRWLDVVTAIGGLHAQLMSAAEQALAIRTKGLVVDHVSGALWRSKDLVKTWAMRGTLHLIASRDLPELVAALSTLKHFRKPHWLKYFKITEQDLDGILAGVAATLTNRGITRERLAAEIARWTKRPAVEASLRSGWGMLLKPAAFAGHLCFGPSDGQKVTFVRPDRWLGAWHRPDSENALLGIGRRYLAAYGPARADDFSRWLGLDPAAAKRVFRRLGDELAEVEVDGWRGQVLAESLPAMARAKSPNGMILLPFFDPYTVAVSRQAPFLFPEKFRARVYRSQGWISPVLLVDGQIAGTWALDRVKDGAVVTITPFARLPASRRSEAEAAASFLARDGKLPVVRIPR